MEWILPLIGGLGIGALLARVVDYFLSKRSKADERAYQEMREAYLGLLNALHQAAVRPSDENSKNYALWQTRCQLFGSQRVAKSAQDMVDTNEGPREARQYAHERLIEAMRDDLKKR